MLSLLTMLKTLMTSQLGQEVTSELIALIIDEVKKHLADKSIVKVTTQPTGYKLEVEPGDHVPGLEI